MRWLRETNDQIKNLLHSLSVNKKRVMVVIYLILAISIIVCILAIFSVAYTGSYNPRDLLRSDNFTFSYAGTPAYVNVYSDSYDIGISGINNTRANLTLEGKSTLTLYPDGPIKQTLNNGPEEQISGNYTIRTFPLDITDVYLSVSQENDFDYNMNFQFNNTEWGPTIGKDDVNCLRMIKRGHNQYKIKSSFYDPATKFFRVKNDPRYNYSFPIVIRIINITTSDTGVEMETVKIINYTGRIDISINGGLTMEIPVSAISPTDRNFLNEITLDHCEGTLDVRQAEYKCSPADNIAITSANNSTTLQLLNGEIVTTGMAHSLQFRQRDFGQPISVILKEGNIAIFTGLLSSFLTIIIGRLIAQFKK